MRRLQLSCVLFVLLVVGCLVGRSDIKILSPEPNVPVLTPDFDVVVELDPDVDVTTLAATLNGTPIALAPAASGSYVASFSRGDPLRDRNLLVVTAQRVDGTPVDADRAFDWLPAKARAHRITSSADLIEGPLAHGQEGDWLIANDVARFIVQDVAKRDLYSVGQYGGNIIDAELLSRPGGDNFLEIQPMVNIETVINAQTATVLNDGQNGLAAMVETCGPDDLLDFINPSTEVAALGVAVPPGIDDFDYDVWGCTTYELLPGDPYVKMVSTLMDTRAPADQIAPIRPFVGDFVNAAGEVDPWPRGPGGLGEILTGLGTNELIYIGSGEADGTQYYVVTTPNSPVRPNADTFSTAGVTVLLQGNSILLAVAGSPSFFIVPKGGSRSWTRYFGVGDGSGADAVMLAAQVRGELTGTISGHVSVGGVPAPGARVAVGPMANGSFSSLVAHFVTDATGHYGGAIPAGDWSVGGWRLGTPYEGNGPMPLLHAVTLPVGGAVVQDIALPATGRLRVNLVNHEGEAMPGRVSVLGSDPSPEPGIIVVDPIGIVGNSLTGTFTDISKDAHPAGIARAEYIGADGTVEFDMEPGQYDVVVSRGAEFSIDRQDAVVISAGQTTVVDARVVRVLDTRGFVSSDFHVHGIRSADSRVTDDRRAMQYAGEGVDNIVMTDHHAHTDLRPMIAAAGLARWVTATVGEEITTWDAGHFNGYPFEILPDRPSGGSTDWARAAPPGDDFPSKGAYVSTPGELWTLATTGAASKPSTTVQINHITSHFCPLEIDTSLVPPQSLLDAAELASGRFDPAAGNLFHHFPALELWNGASRGSQDEFLGGRIGIWFNHLNQGLLTTAIADTDSHTFLSLNAAGARTWTASSTDRPWEIDSDEVAAAVDAGRAVGGQGLFVTASLRPAGGGAVADHRLGGSTTVVAPGGDVVLDVRVQAPLWAEYDRIRVYANASPVPVNCSGDPAEPNPYLFSAGTPALDLALGADFSRVVTQHFAGVPESQRYETNLSLPFDGLAEDTWFVVVVDGSDGISTSMFPVAASNLSSGGVLALGYTNALFADVDGAPGFDPPLP